MEVPFTYGALPKYSIRLLSISREWSFLKFSWELTLKLRTFNFEDAPDYCALSYVWGSPSLTHTITCNGNSMKVASNLYQAIQALKDPRLQLNIPIWIDAICIDQSNSTEKGEQVARMGNIYRCANQVWVWLGPEGNHSDLAMRSIEGLSNRLSKIPTFSILQHSHFEKHNLPSDKDSIWSAIGELYHHEWLGRLWTFQEVVLGAQVKIIHGYEMIDWGIFAGFMREAVRLELGVLLGRQEHLGRGLQAVHHIECARKRMETHNCIPFIAALEIADTRLATNPRDNVYGMLGLVQEAFREKIQVSYDSDPEEGNIQLWISTAKAIAEAEDSLLELLELVPGRLKLNGLPSWCPNFSSPQGSLHAFKSSFFAGRLHGGKSERIASISPRTNALSITGFRVDIVSEVIKGDFNFLGSFDSTTARNLISWEKRCSHLAKKVYSCPPDSVPIEHIYTFTSNTRRTISEGNEKILSVVYQSFLDRMQWFVDRKTPTTIVAPEHQGLYAKTSDQIIMASSGRDYFSTEGGRVGLGPPGIQEGDIVVVLYGAETPFVLRARSPDEGWILKGSAYVYGLMKLKDTKLMPGLAEDEVFEIF